MRAGSGIYPLQISVVSKNDNEINKELFVDENHEIVEEGSENSMDSIEKPIYIDLPSFSKSSMVGSVPSFHNKDSIFVGSNSMKLLPSPSILNSPPQKARASTGPRLLFLDRIHKTAMKSRESQLTSLLDTKNDEMKQKNNTIRKLENENKN